MSVGVWFLLLAFLTLSSAIYGILRYRSPLNPLTIRILYDYGFVTLGSAIVAFYFVTSHTITDEIAIETIIISIVSLIGTTIPFFFHGRLPAHIFGYGLTVLRLNSKNIAVRFSLLKFMMIITTALIAFLLLALTGGGGILWLTKPRTAYQLYRTGAGIFWALTQWMFTFGMLYYLWARKPTGKRLILVLLVFCTVVYFLGSKGFLMALVAITIIYQHFIIRPIPGWKFPIFGILAFVAFICLQLAQGTATIVDAVLYLVDYFDTAAMFLARFDEFNGFQHGRIWLSGFWFFVPRILYPEKPYEYGVLLIHQVLFPGYAETGNTRGFLPWLPIYYDFGMPGVVISAIFTSIVTRGIFEYFLYQRRTFFTFILATHICIWHVWSFVAPSTLIVLSVAQSLFLRSTWKGNHRVPSQPPPVTVAHLAPSGSVQ